MKVFSATLIGSDGLAHNVRYLLDVGELANLQRVGLVGEVGEVIGMCAATDTLVANLQKEFYTACGGLSH